jgi:hypothetical protein
MKRLLIRLFLGVVACGFSLAQSASAQQADAPTQPGQQIPATRSDQSGTDRPNSGMAAGELRIAPGSVIPVQLTKTIDAKKVKTGDEIEAKVTQDLKSGNGDVVLPKDTKVMGHVTEAQARNKEVKESEVGIAFDHAITKSGANVTLPMSIQAIVAPPNSSAANNDASEGVGQSASTPQGAGGMSPANGGGRSAGMGGMPPQAPAPPTTGGESSTSGRTETNANQPVTAKTTGVVGISNLQLSMAANATEGSIVSSEKGNVKLESGTLMLLKVNQ